MRAINELPGPRGLPLLGNVLQLNTGRMHTILSAWADEYGPMYRYRIASQIPPTTYLVSARKNTLIADPKSTQGLYPKIFIASGKTVPAKAPEGKVVHVPYTSLVNADGCAGPGDVMQGGVGKVSTPPETTRRVAATGIIAPRRSRCSAPATKPATFQSPHRRRAS